MDWGEGRIRGYCLMGMQFQFCKMKKFWRWVAQQWEYTYYWIIPLKIVKMVHFM